jgi:hypothetical protein
MDDVTSVRLECLSTLEDFHHEEVPHGVRSTRNATHARNDPARTIGDAPLDSL